MERISNIINGTKFYVSVDESLSSYVQMLFRAINNIPTNRIRDGYKFEIGFSVFICEKEFDGFKVVVPDYMNSPFENTTDDLTIALWILLEQTQVLKMYSIEGVPTRFDDEIVVASGALDSPIISLQRYSDLGKGASGWCIEAIEEKEDQTLQPLPSKDYGAVYAYQILETRPSLIKALVLPFEYVCVFNGDDIIEILNEHDESVIQRLN